MISVQYSSSPSGEKKAIKNIDSYSHEILMLGGYRSAEVSFLSNVQDAESWFFTGVGRHIDSYSIRGNEIWEGMVNIVTIQIGGRSITAGPLLDISNRIKVGFSYPNYGVAGDPNAGKYAELDWKGNLDSQARYGVLEELISGGSSELDPMYELQDHLLDVMSEPKVSETIGESGDVHVMITLSCIGYTRLLEKQVYNRQWEEGLSDVDLSQKAKTILADNRFFIDSRELTIDTEVIGVEVTQVEEKNRTAWGIISDHISKSTLADVIACGMYQNLTFSMVKVGDRVAYTRKAGSNIILDNQNNRVEPSEITPGGLMLMTDFSSPITYRITSVQYDMSENMASLNFSENSLRKILSGTMLGGVYF